MNLIIDIGNTRFKYAFCIPGKVVKIGVGWEKLLEEMEERKLQGEKLAIFLSGSGRIEESLKVQLEKEAAYWLDLSLIHI